MPAGDPIPLDLGRVNALLSTLTLRYHAVYGTSDPPVPVYHADYPDTRTGPPAHRDDLYRGDRVGFLGYTRGAFGWDYLSVAEMQSNARVLVVATGQTDADMCDLLGYPPTVVNEYGTKPDGLFRRRCPRRITSTRAYYSAQNPYAPCVAGNVAQLYGEPETPVSPGPPPDVDPVAQAVAVQTARYRGVHRCVAPGVWEPEPYAPADTLDSSATWRGNGWVPPGLMTLGDYLDPYLLDDLEAVVGAV